MSHGAVRWAYPHLIAHRCGGALAPENTLAGLDVAARLGVKAVEFDAMLSLDGVPVLIHDDTLTRTTNGCGEVAAQTWAQLQTLDAGAHHHLAFAGERIPTLVAALQRCQQLGLAVNLEIKPSPGREAETGRVVAAIAAAHPPSVGLLLSSFSSVALLAAQAEVPALPRAVLLERLDADWRDHLALHQAMAIHTDAKALNVDLAAAICEAGVPLACYTVNTLEAASDLLAMGVSAVFSDRPDLLIDL